MHTYIHAYIHTCIHTHTESFTFRVWLPPVSSAAVLSVVITRAHLFSLGAFYAGTILRIYQHSHGKYLQIK